MTENMDKPQVSIVVPAHNAARTIEKCIESLLSQSYRNIEIIVVENGSEDSTLTVLKTSYGESKVVKILTSPIGSAIHARYIGTMESHGDYIMYCDADDWYSFDAVSILLKSARVYDADIVDAGYKRVILPFPPIVQSRSIVRSIRVVEAGAKSVSDCLRYYNPIRYKFFSGMCGTLYRREVLLALDESVFDNALTRGEDMLVNAMAHSKANRCVELPDLVYSYRLGDGATSKNEGLLGNLLLYKDLLDSYYLPSIPYTKKEVDLEFASYLVNVLFRRYQNAVSADDDHILAFYKEVLSNRRVRNYAAQLVPDTQNAKDCRLAEVFVEGDAEELLEMARRDFRARKRLLKAASFFNSIAARLCGGK